MKYRPWGQLQWVLEKTSVDWTLIGTVSTERRCIAAHNVLASASRMHKAVMLDVQDPPSRFSARSDVFKQASLTEFAAGTHIHEVLSMPLLSRDAELVSLIDSISQSSENVICDISCLPKRFFFPFIKRLLRNQAVRNLVVSYAVPHSYHSGLLAEDHGPLQCLPLFGPAGFEDTTDVVIIGVGFVPLGLAALLEPYKDSTPVELLFPFPPGPPFYQRNLHFIQEIRHALAKQGSDPHRLHAIDVSSAFNHIAALCSQGERRAAFAPYGPKPISLAMCLYASLTGCTVYYTQPKVYHPEYSTGIAMIDGAPNVHAYPIRIDGRDLYSLEPPASLAMIV